MGYDVKSGIGTSLFSAVVPATFGQGKNISLKRHNVHPHPTVVAKISGSPLKDDPPVNC